MTYKVGDVLAAKGLKFKWRCFKDGSDPTLSCFYSNRHPAILRQTTPKKWFVYHRTGPVLVDAKNQIRYFDSPKGAAAAAEADMSTTAGPVSKVSRYHAPAIKLVLPLSRDELSEIHGVLDSEQHVRKLASALGFAYPTTLYQLLLESPLPVEARTHIVELLRNQGSAATTLANRLELGNPDGDESTIIYE